MVVGACVGVFFASANRLAPKKFLPFIPSATSLGVGCINNWGYSFAYFVVCVNARDARNRTVRMASCVSQLTTHNAGRKSSTQRLWFQSIYCDQHTPSRLAQGSSINEIVRLISPQFVEAYSIPLSSGIMAGEAIMGALIAVLAVAGLIPGPDVCKVAVE